MRPVKTGSTHHGGADIQISRERRRPDTGLDLLVKQAAYMCAKSPLLGVNKSMPESRRAAPPGL